MSIKTENEVNEAMDEVMRKYDTFNERKQQGAINDVDEARKEILDILTEHADDDDRISKSKIKRIFRELDDVEDDIQERIEKRTDDNIDQSSEKAIKWTVTALGVAALSETFSQEKLRKSVRKTVRNMTRDDGLSKKDRTQRVAGNIIDDVRKEIRSGALKGTKVSTLNHLVKRSVANKTWQVRRIVSSEGWDSFRRSIIGVAKETNVVRAVKIIDNRGRHPYHHSHECYKLAEQNMYGWGKGIYRIDDSFIYYPHPQCTAYYHFKFVNPDDGTVGEAP